MSEPKRKVEGVWPVRHRMIQVEHFETEPILCDACQVGRSDACAKRVFVGWGRFEPCVNADPRP